MQDEPFYPLGHLDGAEAGVQSTLDGQDILVQHGEPGRRLACLLGHENAAIVSQGDGLFLRIPHNHEVDEILMELVDLFISIRYAHPTLVQLELVLPAASGSEEMAFDEPGQ